MQIETEIVANKQTKKLDLNMLVGIGLHVIYLTFIFDDTNLIFEFVQPISKFLYPFNIEYKSMKDTPPSYCHWYR